MLSKNGIAEISSIRNGCYILLDEYQLENLKHHLSSFNETVLTYLYENYLSTLITHKLLPSETCDEEFTSLELLVSFIEKEVQKVFKSDYACLGCVYNSPAQLCHACMTSSDLEKFVSLGELRGVFHQPEPMELRKLINVIR